jgi:hypothetical protein
MRTLIARSRLYKTGSSAMQRPPYEQAAPIDLRLTEESQRLRKEAQGTPPGIARDRLIRRARQAETAAHMQEWLRSPGLKPPT